jgi:hypothetical protein
MIRETVREYDQWDACLSPVFDPFEGLVFFAVIKIFHLVLVAAELGVSP